MIPSPPTNQTHHRVRLSFPHIRQPSLLFFYSKKIPDWIRVPVGLSFGVPFARLERIVKHFSLLFISSLSSEDELCPNVPFPPVSSVSVWNGDPVVSASLQYIFARRRFSPRPIVYGLLPGWGRVPPAALSYDFFSSLFFKGRTQTLSQFLLVPSPKACFSSS